MVPVKTDRPIPENLKFRCMEVINSIELESPVKVGDIAAANVLGTDVNIIVTRSM